MEVVGTVSAILGNKGQQVWTISPDATVYEAIRTMAEKNIGALLVVQEGKPVGMISERDYARKIVLQGRTSRDTLVSEVLSTHLISATPQTSIAECMKLMTEHRIRHLPVLDGDRVLGIVSIGDLINWIISSQSSVIEQLTNYIAGQYPG
jgi:CBS domain-containing protein